MVYFWCCEVELEGHTEKISGALTYGEIIKAGEIEIVYEQIKDMIAEECNYPENSKVSLIAFNPLSLS